MTASGSPERSHPYVIGFTRVTRTLPARTDSGVVASVSYGPRGQVRHVTVQCPDRTMVLTARQLKGSQYTIEQGGALDAQDVASVALSRYSVGDVVRVAGQDRGYRVVRVNPDLSLRLVSQDGVRTVPRIALRHVRAI